MTRRIGAAVVAVSLTFGGSAAITFALASPSPAAAQQPRAEKAADFSARRRTRHHDRYAYRAYYPTYYERPYYYAPLPYVPFNFGYGVGPWAWW